MNNTPLLDEWPKISFDELDAAEIDFRPARILYKSLIFLFFFPERTIHAFLTVWKSEG